MADTPSATLESLTVPVQAASRAIGEGRGHRDAPAVHAALTRRQATALIAAYHSTSYLPGDVTRALPPQAREAADFPSPGATTGWKGYRLALAAMLITERQRSQLREAGYDDADIAEATRTPSWIGLTHGWEKALVEHLVRAIAATA